MGLIPLGILSSAGGSLGSYELIQSTILGTTATDVTFSGLAAYAADYKHLQFRYVARDTNTALNIRNTTMRFNSDTTTYISHNLVGDGASVTSGVITANTTGYPGIYYSGASTQIYGAGIIDILDPYNTSKNTTVRSLNGFAGNGAVVLSSFLYIDTQAVGSITIFATGTTFAIGSRFSIYGIR
jgi:hypothetical protein